MYERFTDRARKTMQLANQEAQRNNNEFIAPEHILLGLVKEGGGVAANVLAALGKTLDLGDVRRMLETAHPSRSDSMISMGKMPHTPLAKQVIQAAICAAKALNHNYVGTEHLLLGLLAVEDTPARMYLSEKGITACAVEKGIVELLKDKDTPRDKPAGDSLKEMADAEPHVFTALIGVPQFKREPAKINTAKYWYARTVTSGEQRVRVEFGADTLPELMALIEAKPSGK